MRLIRLWVIWLVLVLSASTSSAAYGQYDVVIRGGRLLDGAGNPWRHADVGVLGDRIAAIGDLGSAEARRTVDASGLYVAPGFIDVHSHAGPGLATRELSGAEPLLSQGITTVVINPDGGGATDLRTQRQRLLDAGLGVNVAQLVPHGAIRREIMGMAAREPTSAEMDLMSELTRRGMEAGAFGLSSGLYYAPGSYAATEEVIALAKVVAEYGGVYTSHIRDEADYNVGVVAAVEEVIRIAKEARLPGIVTHIKALGPRVWGYSQAIVMRIRQARADGIEVFADQYPYAASGTGIIGALIPRWALVGGRKELLRRIDDPADGSRLRRAVAENLDRRGGAARLQFQRYRPDPSIEGQTMQAVAEDRAMDPAELSLTLVRDGDAGLVSFNMNEDDIVTFMRQPWTMTSSDGGLVGMNVGVPHPRYYGTFPRKIHKYVVEERVIDLAAAVRSMTSLSAGVFGMAGRGLLREGAVADIAVFDLERTRDIATYRDPHHLSEGMVYVLVGGEFAIDGGRFTGTNNGKVLSHRSEGAVP
ncbi:MAG: amidohydrolase family protein [Gemmatimonadales bacterium]